MEETGFDTEGREYSNASDFWHSELTGEGITNWYSKAVKFWNQQEPSYNGVLGGYGHLSGVDLRDSAAFLKGFVSPLLKARAQEGETTCALDCGAGVGRVSEGLLLHFFDEVDLLEPSKQLLDSAKDMLSKPNSYGYSGNAVNFFCSGLQDFKPKPQRYDCIWMQWVLLYLTDDDVVSSLKCCKEGLKPGSCIVIKENICNLGFVVDRSDNSISRSHRYMLELFDLSGLKVLQHADQKRWPQEVYTVRMYATQPC